MAKNKKDMTRELNELLREELLRAENRPSAHVRMPHMPDKVQTPKTIYNRARSKRQWKEDI